jgi:acyl-CoA synthetase (AMP-forming)/AMP-acid ligase II
VFLILLTIHLQSASKHFSELYIDPNTSEHYTYSTLQQTSLNFATSLHHTLKLRKGDVLALFLQNNINTAAVMFGTHYLGGIVSPANPAYTVRELVHHLKDSGAKILVTQASLLKVALGAAREVSIAEDHVIVVDDVGKGKASGGLRAFKRFVEEGKTKETPKKAKLDQKKDLAYLVYSSGTTGLPKGVMLSHRNVISNLAMLRATDGRMLNHQSRVLSVLPFYHIYGMYPTLLQDGGNTDKSQDYSVWLACQSSWVLRRMSCSLLTSRAFAR